MGERVGEEEQLSLQRSEVRVEMWMRDSSSRASQRALLTLQQRDLVISWYVARGIDKPTLLVEGLRGPTEKPALGPGSSEDCCTTSRPRLLSVAEPRTDSCELSPHHRPL